LRARNRLHLRCTIAAANPSKLVLCQTLVADHVSAGDKVLVFADSIIVLQEYASVLRCPILYGATSHRDRMKIYSDFQNTKTVNVICVSRVGDTSVNLPSASVVVQVSSHGGSRRQEAQRLGRILRPKRSFSTSSVGGIDNDRRNSATFYTLVSSDTIEITYATRRQQYLVDQGYSYRVQLFSPPPATASSETNGSNASMSVVSPAFSHQRELKWLAKIVAHWEELPHVVGLHLQRDYLVEGGRNSDSDASLSDEDVEGPSGQNDVADGDGLVVHAMVNTANQLSNYTLGDDDIVYQEFT